MSPTGGAWSRGPRRRSSPTPTSVCTRPLVRSSSSKRRRHACADRARWSTSAPTRRGTCPSLSLRWSATAAWKWSATRSETTSAPAASKARTRCTYPRQRSSTAAARWARRLRWRGTTRLQTGGSASRSGVPGPSCSPARPRPRRCGARSRSSCGTWAVIRASRTGACCSRAPASCRRQT